MITDNHAKEEIFAATILNIPIKPVLKDIINGKTNFKKMVFKHTNITQKEFEIEFSYFSTNKIYYINGKAYAPAY